MISKICLNKFLSFAVRENIIKILSSFSSFSSCCIFPEKGAVRHAVHPRPSVDFQQLFSHYGDEEKQAMACFSFLDDFPSSNNHSADEGGANGRKGRTNMSYSSKSRTLPLGRTGYQEYRRYPSDPTGNDLPYRDFHDNGQVSAAYNLPPPRNRTVHMLREEHRHDSREGKRLSSSSFESAHSYGGEGFSLSDSCFENFSVSDANVTDMGTI